MLVYCAVFFLQAGIDLIFLFAKSIIEKKRIKIDTNHAPVSGNRRQHIVSKVSWMIAQRSRARMRRDNRFGRYSQHVIERLIRNVRYIDDHPNSVHFADYAATHLSQTAVMFN